MGNGCRMDYKFWFHLRCSQSLLEFFTQPRRLSSRFICTHIRLPCCRAMFIRLNNSLVSIFSILRLVYIFLITVILQFGLCYIALCIPGPLHIVSVHLVKGLVTLVEIIIHGIPNDTFLPTTTLKHPRVVRPFICPVVVFQ